MFGDFNEVRSPEKRINSEFNPRGASDFNDFIRMNELVDIPMGGSDLQEFVIMVTNLANLIGF